MAKTLVLTGASRGIGHATVKRFSAEGWRVVTCSRQPFSSNCPWEGGPGNHVQIDLADPEDLARGLGEMRKRLDGAGLAALVNNAGISPKAESGGRLGCLDTEIETWHRVFQVNFYAPLLLARGLIGELEAAGGSIVNVASIAGARVHPYAGAAYATSKAALSALTREMAAEFGPLGVRVNAIAPGEIETPILSSGTATLIPRIPIGRLGHAAEVADTIYFLCTDGASYINGAEIFIDGGQHVG
jgi:NAD(P)-dependent dehydrogenase (short-subunit alcohol dehydrogenase family)